MKQNRKKKKLRIGRIKEYEANYLIKTNFVMRESKMIYVKPEIHQKISQIVLLSTSKKIRMGDYVQNVLEEHFQKYHLEIQSLCFGALNEQG